MMPATSVTAGLKSYRGKWGSDEVSHLLRRTMFGVKRDDLRYFLKLSPKQAIKELISLEYPPPAPPVNNYNNDRYTDPDVPAGQTWTNSLQYDGMSNARRKSSFKSWWMGLMIGQDRSIREKMVIFWHNHFVTETNTVNNAGSCWRYHALLRRHALGNFRQFVKDMTAEPAMLRYLNGAANTKKAPDENYGRELQELFTIGKGPGSHYTEDDVKAAARVLTGYTVNGKTQTSSFDARRHDEGDKQFSSFYDNRLIHGRKGPEGADELDDLLDMIFSKEEVSLFICRKLYRFFVYHDIDAVAEEKIIRPLAAQFRKNNYEIGPVLGLLLGSCHFFDPANRGSNIKSPLDLTVGLCRELDLQFPDATDYQEQYSCWEQIRNQAAAMQQNIGDPPNVAGWQAYYQAPEYDKLWISSDTLPRRNQFTDRMIGNGFARNGKRIQADLAAFAAGLDAPGNPDKLIDGAIQALYAVDPGPQARQFIKTDILLAGLSGQMADHYWTNAWLAFRQDPDNDVNRSIVETKLKLLFKYLLSSPEYQLV